MHLVFVSSLVPSGPPESGYEIANHAIIDGLRRTGAKVTVLGFKWPDATLSDPDNTVCLGEVDVKTEMARRGGRRRPHLFLGEIAGGGGSGDPAGAGSPRAV